MTGKLKKKVIYHNVCRSLHENSELIKLLQASPKCQMLTLLNSNFLFFIFYFFGGGRYMQCLSLKINYISLERLS